MIETYAGGGDVSQFNSVPPHLQYDLRLNDRKAGLLTFPLTNSETTPALKTPTPMDMDIELALAVQGRGTVTLTDLVFAESQVLSVLPYIKSVCTTIFLFPHQA